MTNNPLGGVAHRDEWPVAVGWATRDDSTTEKAQQRIGPRMTYCVGVLLDAGLVLASDSRTHAGVDNFATFSKMSVFERPDDRVIVLLSSGNLAGTQAVISVLKQRGETQGIDGANVWSARTMFDVAMIVSDAVRDVERRDGKYLLSSATPFSASFIIGGQIKGEPLRLFRTFAEGNFIEAGTHTPYFQTGEAKYGKPIIEPVIGASTSLSDAIKCVLVSFDSTMRSNLSVGMPIDLACYERDSLKLSIRARFEHGNAYFSALSKQWTEGVRDVFRRLPAVPL
jgi:putative proteasome-type protease